MKFSSGLLAAVLCACASNSLLAGGCPPAGYSQQALLELRQGGFDIVDDGERNSLAVSLMACVGDPEPDIRDGVVFEGISKWLRANSLTRQTIDSLYTSLTAQLLDESDINGFQQPFAVLALSEVARTDRVEAWFTPERRDELVRLAATYLSSVRDYRGFSDNEGWRHGVAHGSDLVLQLILNPEINSAQTEQLMTAVATQISPTGNVSYIFGESGRLARSVFYAYRNGALDDEWWSNWFSDLGDPVPLASWGEAYLSEAGLARRHNTLAFLLAMHLNATAAGNEQGEALTALVMKTIARVLGG